MIASVKPKRMALYVNNKKLPLSDIQRETGADYIINAGFYDMATFRPVGVLISNGDTLVYDWNGEGVGFDSDGVTFGWSHMTRHKNFVSGIVLVSGGEARTKLDYPAEVGGARRRTAIGKAASGGVVLYCSPVSTTPEALREIMLSQGCVDAIMLDGGGSTQGVFAADAVHSVRRVHNYILIWTDGEEPKVSIEPTGIVKRGSKGENVRWVQEQLNKLHAFDLAVDGDFGSATHNAVVLFQDCTGLAVDGIVGPATVAMLKRVVGYVEQTGIVGVSAAELCYGEPSNDDKYMDAYSDASGVNFGGDAEWCQMFVWWCQREAGIDAYRTASCTDAMGHYQDNGKWFSKPVVGRLVYFDWDGSGDCDHVGVVAEATDSEIYVIEGNSGGAGRDAVRLKRYGISEGVIRGYADVLSEPQKLTQKCFVAFSDEADALNFAEALKLSYPSVYVTKEV